MGFFAVHRNGRPATVDDLAPLAFAGNAHFTAMQVRDGRARGLDLHLARLREASRELFGVALPDDRVRAAMRVAVEAGPPAVTLTATMYPGPGDEPDLLVRTRAAASPPAGPLALAAYEYERFLPAVKHVGELAKSYLARRAGRDGFDDAAFVDRNGRLTEASIWNLVFADGDSIVWPEAPMLVGTTMGVLRRQLARLGVPQRTRPVTVDDLPGYAGAAVLNSRTPGVPVSRIGPVPMPEAAGFLAALHRAYEAEPPVEI
ncbi:aminotransferase class IV family protein [Micromonospora sp. WMMC241]|uniref:aminotransferase class IV family protein n=1 Tax=Micromonospora sp. WMMC241 TaxID=3015159 RepID=UPI0022B74AD6|nr:aminotransferase class IV family protein [Micromonospora sp. WMMC241]MCZ7440545.1 aminotransferase class IV family protein [Micromonospora sp. WMMC241]